MSHILDRAAWNALQTSHADIAEGGDLARRYPPSIVPFAAMRDQSPESWDALANLLSGEEVAAIVELGPLEIPPTLEVVREMQLVQMIAQGPYERISDPRIEPLTSADAEEMLDLANLTKPGPFTLGAQKLGTFWGIKVDGKLVAMGGQRLRQPGFAELSGLCTHPDFQGRGFGKLLFRFVAGEISARGDTVYLHAFSGNTTAISLYEALGFKLRATFNLRAVKRRAA
ncbi:GNAT family N-acetyltransferase [Neorhizobium sp. P12A]|uniref:GNAT family N-acetyltransferase n=1 Tax=Neorhizobium sp. P12A TaxID=2268027 RepID=UPI0011ECDFC1|nr:GNAT family N-acetyltransferase [Neorhizobium sp. P12A]KAA0700526.1 GNAT family N-acetyltransferase [Neorhizobium sp. P12A]